MPSPLNDMVFPTAWNLVAPTNPAAVFMPTASGNPESALFGSTRTGADGRARFHAGVDIAPVARDSRGRPLDPVLAVADGRVAYINRAAGGSSYGLYVVLLHDDPVGEIYTLYAHLASVSRGLTPGDVVSTGDTIGRMGNTDNTGIPMARAHLHLELGVLLSDRFGAWARERGVRPDRGNYHGWNFFPLDPLDVYAQRHVAEHFSLLRYLRTVPAAFEWVLVPARPLNYFVRYPGLWQGPSPQAGKAIVLRISEGGVILSGRTATDEEFAHVPEAPGGVFVQNVNEDVLGRNGMRWVERRGSRWVLGRAAARWLEVLQY